MKVQKVSILTLLLVVAVVINTLTTIFLVDLGQDHLPPFLGHIAVLRTCLDAAYCYRWSSEVCLLVCHSYEPCKND